MLKKGMSKLGHSGCQWTGKRVAGLNVFISCKAFFGSTWKLQDRG
ncbi:hypothetical protein HanXRQr2_Chr03g0123871 [Helianthus annuus]|uniref:Uncharacterized protein n=1 Tax=Helianthus annuus TaxID=4232 RepID=A0A9K3JIC9_HELAN|nr:hypothetical protein HanXRQr2_Chr03g0123871 [Helianthus annuus]